MRKTAAAAILVLVWLAAPIARAGAAATCPATWKLVASDTFRLHDALLRSQGVTTDGRGWVFSWQGGLERTVDDFTPVALGSLPPQLAVAPSLDPGGGNH